MGNAISPDWIAVDWGTSAFRAWAISDTGEVLGEAQSDRGMSTLERPEFEGALRDLAGGWLANSAPVLACGMVGSRQGWVEAAYTPVPCSPVDYTVVNAPTQEPHFSVFVVGGIRQDQPADVMRGEETQIAGLLARDPVFDGVVCLPGTHTKWVHVSAGEIVSFRTSMTGELFALLSKNSVLRHTIGEGWDDAAFEEALSDALSRPEALAARLFSVRADGLINDLRPGSARARVSGILIGAELAAMRPYWLGQRIAIVGAPGLSHVYAAALRVQGLEPEIFASDEMTRAGLAGLRARLKEDA